MLHCVCTLGLGVSWVGRAQPPVLGAAASCMDVPRVGFASSVLLWMSHFSPWRQTRSVGSSLWAVLWGKDFPPDQKDGTCVREWDFSWKAMLCQDLLCREPPWEGMLLVLRLRSRPCCAPLPFAAGGVVGHFSSSSLGVTCGKCVFVWAPLCCDGSRGNHVFRISKRTAREMTAVTTREPGQRQADKEQPDAARRPPAQARPRSATAPS